MSFSGVKSLSSKVLAPKIETAQSLISNEFKDWAALEDLKWLTQLQERSMLEKQSYCLV